MFQCLNRRDRPSSEQPSTSSKRIARFNASIGGIDLQAIATGGGGGQYYCFNASIGGIDLQAAVSFFAECWLQVSTPQSAGSTFKLGSIQFDVEVCNVSMPQS